MPSLLFLSKNDKIPGLASARRFFSKGSGPPKISMHTMSYTADVSTPPSSSPSPTERTSAEAPLYQVVPPAVVPLPPSPEAPPKAQSGSGNAQHTPDSGYHSVPSSSLSNPHSPIPVRHPTATASLNRSTRPAITENAADYFKHRRMYHHSESEMRLSPSITLVRPFTLPLPVPPPIQLTLPPSQGQNLSSVPSLYHTADERPAPEDGEEMDDGTMSEGEDVDDTASDVSGTGSSASGTRSAEGAVVTGIIPNLSPPPPPTRARVPRRLPLVSIVPPNEHLGADVLPDAQTQAAVITPRGDLSLGDYFSKPVAPWTSARTPRPVDFNAAPVENPDPPIPTPSHRRPKFYQQASRSMINLGPTTLTAPVPSIVPLTSPPLTPVMTEAPPPSIGTARPQTTVRRRRSLPDMAKAPPPYSALFPIGPRDDEGREKLPAYTCRVHIEGILHRKMEFSQPGIQARDRSWRRLFFILNGTSLRVYKADPRKVAIKQQLDRSRIAKIQIDASRIETEGEVDISAPHVHFPLEAMSPTTQQKAFAAMAKEAAARRQSQQLMLQWQIEEEHAQRAAEQAEERASRRASSNSTASNSRLRPPSSTFSGPMAFESSSANATASGFGSSSQTPGNDAADWSMAGAKMASDESARLSLGKAFPSLHSTLPSSPSSSRFALHGPFSSGNMLLRQYTLQHAESGLGSDYLKRRNVMRVRAEGEQFLLQAESVMDVVNWIEAFQAATNVALDLDERMMPKVPSLPRRRRRRRPRPPPGAPVGAEGPDGSRHHQ